MKDKRLISVIVSLIFFIPGVAIEKATGIFAAYFTLYALAWTAAAWSVVLKAARNISRGIIFDENFLMLIASVGAFVLNLVFKDFAELNSRGGGEAMMDGVLVMILYQVGEYFQALAVRRSRKNIRSLLSLRPDSATVLRGGKEVTVSPEDVETGETVIVRAGERIPLDGKVTDGASYIDTSAITGESVPVYAGQGSEVKSGCIASDGLIQIEVTKKFEESTACRMLALVEDAAEKKSAQETFISKFAKIYTPIVCAAAVAIAVIPSLIIQLAYGVNAWNDWIYTALSLLVVSCPCALVISVPLTFFGGIGGASKLGILIKGANCFSAFASADTVAVDKTGTLTEGRFAIKENRTDEETFGMLVACENKFNHPIARAFDLPTPYVCTSAEDVAGHGIRAVCDGKKVVAGNSTFLRGCGIKFEDAHSPFTVIYIAVNGEYKGYVTVADKVRPSSVRAIKALRADGEKTVMLTGDKKEAALAVAKETGVDETRFGLLPEDKAEEVRKLQRNGHKVIFCGDGINDAPVLATADIGCAMGGIGSDAAIEAADVVIMNDDLTKVLKGKKHARKVISVAMQNIVGSIIIKVAIMALAIALPAFPLWLAIIGDVGVCLAAIANSFRVLTR